MISKVLNNRYEIIELIGRGGMAYVYKAKDRKLNRYVAVKVLREEYTENEQFIKKFDRESQAAAGLSHPNIVSVYDVGVEGDIYYIIMEYVDGITLKQYLNKKGHLDYKEATRFIIDVAAALKCAHEHKIIHRDIKPHNILLTRDLVPKVADFGIARAITSSYGNHDQPDHGLCPLYFTGAGEADLWMSVPTFIPLALCIMSC